MTIADLLVLFKERLGKFQCSVVDDVLTPDDVTYTKFNSGNQNWVDLPEPEIRVIASGVETYIFPTEYVVDSAAGSITFNTARTSTDVVKGSYSIKPFTDDQLTSMLSQSTREIQVLTFHNINFADISPNYSEAIIKKALTMALRTIQIPSTKYFSISISGRTMDKSQQVTQIEALITSNEKELLMDINAIRYFDKTNVLR